MRSMVEGFLALRTPPPPTTVIAADGLSPGQARKRRAIPANPRGGISQPRHFPVSIHRSSGFSGAIQATPAIT